MDLSEGFRKKVAHVKILVVGGSSVFTANHSGSERRRKELNQMRIQVEKGRVAERFKSQEFLENNVQVPAWRSLCI
jgi:hypothetical protein